MADHCVGWYVVGAIGALSDRAQAAAWLRATATVAATEQVSRAVKRHINRSRPHLEGLPPLAGVTSTGSFPSSHAATAAAAMIAYQGLLPRRGLLGWAALTASSRPYLGVHYPSDVIAGLALGSLLGCITRPLTATRTALTASPRATGLQRGSLPRAWDQKSTKRK